MNDSDIIPINPRSSNRPSVAGDHGPDYIQSMFEVAESVQQLFSVVLNPDPINSEESQASVTSGDTEEKAEKGVLAVQETAIPAFDILANTFMQSVVNYVAGVSGLSIGLLVTSKSEIGRAHV